MEKNTSTKNSNVKGIIALLLVILATIWTLIVFSKLGKENLEMVMGIYDVSFFEKVVVMIGLIIIQLVMAIIAFFLAKSERKTHITKINSVSFYLSIGIFILVVIQCIIILSA